MAWPAIAATVNEKAVFDRDSGHTFAPGFRLSRLDVTILVVGVAVALALSMAVPWCGLVVGLVLGHFFLFCNVVRLSRSLELVWAAVFTTLAAATVALDAPGWSVTVSVSLVATMAVVVVEMRKRSYHGVGWQWINPGLPDWWRSRGSRSGGG